MLDLCLKGFIGVHVGLRLKWVNMVGKLLQSDISMLNDFHISPSVLKTNNLNILP